MDGFAFACVDGHIAWVDEHIAAALDRAAQAGRPLDRGAYGVIGTVFADAATQAAAAASRAVGELAAAGASFADGLRATRDGYHEAERATTELLGGTP